MREPFQDNLVQFPRLRREPSWSDDPLGIMPYINWLSEILHEAYRTMKPGAVGAVWSIPRTCKSGILEPANWSIPRTMPKVFIYGLTDDSGDVRYVGKSKFPLVRFRHHLAPSQLKASTPKNEWIKSLLQQGKKPGIVELEACDPSEWESREKYWIAHYRQSGKLLNMTDGGGGVFAQKPVMTPEIAAKISAAQKGKKWSADDPRRKFLRKWSKKNLQFQRMATEAATVANCIGWVLIDPNGNEIHVENLSQFCKGKGLNSRHLYNVANHSRKQYKGWYCFRKDEYDDTALERHLAPYKERRRIADEKRRLNRLKNRP